MDYTFIAIALLLSYLLGSIPNAVWIGKMFFGIDVREHGSGNAGATNTLRVLGKKAGISVLILDFLKGLAASSLPLLQNEIVSGNPEYRHYQLLFGIASVLGHVYPVFAGFRGGKGIATLFGMIVGISWPVAFLCVLVFAGTVWLSRFISLGSMMGAVMSPVFVRAIYGSEETFFMYFCIGIALMVIYTHRSNIQRLRAGTETKFSFGKKPEIEIK